MRLSVFPFSLFVVTGFRFVHVGFLCGTLIISSAQAQGIKIGSPVSTGEAVGILVGAGAAIGLIVYLVIPKQKTIEGCVGSVDNSMKLTDVSGKTYVLEGDAGTIKPGQHMKVKGKKSKDRTGILRLSIRKVVKDFGPCAPTTVR